MKCFDEGISLDGNDDVGKNWCHIDDYELLSDIFNKVPTKNDGELAYIYDKETQYGGTFVNIKISGHVLLNQCGTIFTRKKY